MPFLSFNSRGKEGKSALLILSIDFLTFSFYICFSLRLDLLLPSFYDIVECNTTDIIWGQAPRPLFPPIEVHITKKDTMDKF